MIRVREVFREERLIWWLLLAATLIRIGALIDKGIYFDPNFSDATGYMESARVLAETGRLTFYENDPSAWVMPGFVAFLAFFHLVTADVLLQYVMVKGSMLLMSVASIYVLYLIGKRLGGVKVGLVSAAMLAVSMPHIYTGTLTLSENAFAPLVLVFVLLVIRLVDDHRWSTYLWGVAALVAAMYCKQAAIGLLPAALVYLLVRKYPTALLVRQVVLTTVILVLSLAPWWVRNYRAFGEFVPFTGMDAATVYQGTYQEFQPYRTGAVEAIGELIEDVDGSEIDQNRVIAGAAADRMSAKWAEDPWGMLRTYLVMKPAAAWLIPFYWDKVFGISGYWILRLHAVSSALGLALLGWLTVRSRRRPEFLLLFMNVALITAGAGYYLGLSRYVYPFVPFLYVAIAYSIVGLMGYLSRTRRAVESD